MLTFDVDGFIRELFDFMCNDFAEDVLNSVLKDMKESMRWERSTTDIREGTIEIDDVKKEINVVIESYGFAIIESFGTGEKSVAPEEYWASYMQSAAWNKVRTSKTIVGRPSVEKEPIQEDIFGRSLTPTGTREGDPLSEGIAPVSKGIQLTEQNWINKKAMDMLYDELIGVRNDGWIMRNIPRFFIEGGD